MFGILTFLAGAYLLCKGTKEACRPTCPPMTDFNVYREDVLAGLDAKTIHQNHLNGKYTKSDTNTNDKGIDFLNFDGIAFNDDALKYGFVQADKWARQGKYKWKIEIDKVKEK